AGHPTGVAAQTGEPPAATLAVGGARRSGQFFGDDGESTWNAPEMMSALSCSTSSSSAGSSLLSQSCAGAMPTPSFSRVPMYGVLLKSPTAAADVTSSAAVV